MTQTVPELEKAREAALRYAWREAFDLFAAADADDLIARFGVYAASEASARADRSRDLGNVVHFCRWRQIARMIEMLSLSDRADATLH